VVKTNRSGESSNTAKVIVIQRVVERGKNKQKEFRENGKKSVESTLVNGFSRILPFCFVLPFGLFTKVFIVMG